MDPQYFSSSEENDSPRIPNSPNLLGLALTKVAAGDASILQGLRAVAWSTYQEEGAPYGSNERSMERWWADQLATPIG